MAKAKAAVAEDDVLDGKDDVLDGKKATKKASKKAPPAKKASGKKAADPEPAKKTASAKKPKAKQRAADVGATEDVRAALLKCRKLTSYADIAESSGFNIRQIRRTARSMRDAGELTLEKEGTVVYVKKA